MGDVNTGIHHVAPGYMDMLSDSELDQDVFEELQLVPKKKLGRSGSMVSMAATVEHPKTLRTLKLIPMRGHKKLNKSREMMFDNEVSILSVLKHPCIQELLDTYVCPTYFVICYNYYSQGDLLDVIKTRHNPDIPSYFAHMTCALRYLHSRKVIHRDIWPGHFVVNDQNEVVLIDFSKAMTLKDSSAKLALQGCRPGYMAPEIDGKTLVDPYMVDMYALGVTYWNMIFGRLVRSNEHLYEKISCYSNNVPYLDRDAGKRIRKMLGRVVLTNLLGCQPTLRWNIYELIKLYCGIMPELEDIYEDF